MLDIIIRKNKIGGNGTVLELAYANGNCLIDDDLYDLRKTIETVVWEAGKVGLRVNTRKTEIMKTLIDWAPKIDIEYETFQEVEKLVYHWCEMRKDGDIRDDKAGAAFKKMDKVWNENSMSLRAKLKLFNIGG